MTKQPFKKNFYDEYKNSEWNCPVQILAVCVAYSMSSRCHVIPCNIFWKPKLMGNERVQVII